MKLSVEALKTLESESGRIIVAYSGGCDSHVLLHLLASTLEQPIEALHINHGLSQNADDWQAHVESVCDTLNIPLTTFQVEVTLNGSIETNARQARYEVFESFLGRDDVLLLGHHLDDQIETVFLNMMSGRAPFGLQGMPERRDVGRGSLYRPMLSVERADIVAYAEAQNLSWIEDESNQETAFDRNYLRHEVMPRFGARWPDFKTAIVSQTRRASLQHELVEEIAESHWRTLSISLDCIDALGFDALPPNQAALLLRFWLRRVGVDRSPAHATLQSAVSVLSADSSESPIFEIGGYSFQRFRNRMVLVKHATSDRHDDTKLKSGSAEFGSGIVTADIAKGIGVAIPPAQLTLKARTTGEELVLNGHHRTLKKLYQSSGIPPLVRDRVPMIFVDDQFIGIAGIPGWGIPMVVGDEVRVAADAEGCAISWSPHTK